VLQALAALCAVSSGSSSSSSSSSSCRSDSIAAYAARKNAAAALSVASHLPANAVRMATEPLLTDTINDTAATASAGAATVAAALRTLCADASAGGEARGYAAVALGNIAHSGGAAARDTLGQLEAVEALLSIVQAAVSSRKQVSISTLYYVLAVVIAQTVDRTTLSPFSGGYARLSLYKRVTAIASVFWLTLLPGLCFMYHSHLLLLGECCCS
jgi:hypothetical protein